MYHVQRKRLATPHIIFSTYAFFTPMAKVYIVELTELEFLRKFLLFLVFLFLQTLVQCTVVNCSLRALCNRSNLYA